MEESNRITVEFAECWQAAGRHLAKQSDSSLSWIKASLDALIVEHFSFRLGNQIIFVQVEDVDGNLVYPSQREAFLKKANDWKGVPCVMPMKKGSDDWKPMLPNWGLQHALTNDLIIPPALISDETIEINDYELQDFAVRIVRNKLLEEGKEVTSTQSDPRLFPSLWFFDGEKLSWVIVKAARYPTKEATPPSNMKEIALRMLSAGYRGYFASVTVANANDPFDPTAETSGNYLPLTRGVLYSWSFKGLEPVNV